MKPIETQDRTTRRLADILRSRLCWLGASPLESGRFHQRAPSEACRESSTHRTRTERKLAPLAAFLILLNSCGAADRLAWRQLSLDLRNFYVSGAGSRIGVDTWAVGSISVYQQDRGWMPVSAAAERLYGGRWVRYRLPSVGQLPRYNAIASLSASDAWAVGDVLDGTALVAQWDGHRWLARPTIHTADEQVYLDGLAGKSDQDIWAVGWELSVRPFGEQTPLAAHWNGIAWSTYEFNRIPGALHGVAIVSSDDVWAVGDNNGKVATMHWDGQRWSTFTASRPISGSLNAISFDSRSDIWAVGGEPTESRDKVRPLVEHWNGVRWSDVPTALRAGGLNGVTLVSSSDIWAVGTTSGDVGSQNILILHWDGHAWSVADAPTVRGSLNAVVQGAAAGDEIAVGGVSDGSSGLILSTS